MFLKSLTIRNDSGIIRNVVFQSGMNLIVDETIGGSTATGNNVGKTTVLRLIAYCLGKDKKAIYRDPEFNQKSDTQVEQFLINTRAIVKLTLKKDLNSKGFDDEIVIERNFLSRNKKLLTINGKPYSDTKPAGESEFATYLKEEIFAYTGARPTFNQMLNKNIRLDEQSLLNTVRVLHNTTKAAEYEALYLYWLGIEPEENKIEYDSQLRTETRLLKRLIKEYNTAQEVLDLLSVIEQKISKLEDKKSTFYINEHYEQDLGSLLEISRTLIHSQEQLAFLKMKRDIVEESIKTLESEHIDMSVETISMLYQRAKSLLPDIQKTFEQTLAFHQRMKLERATFLSEELPVLHHQIVTINTDIKRLSDEKSVVEPRLEASNTKEELEALILSINECYEQKGEYQSQIKILSETDAKIKTLKQKIELSNQSIEQRASLIQEHITIFNRHFSEISSSLYNEYFTLSAIEENGNYQLTVNSVEGQKGTGRKKGEIAAFDLAYIAFADDISHPCLRFLLYDQLETVHDNQINNLALMVEKMFCQIVVPILKDKLPDDLPPSCHQVLSLSENDKLFRF